MNGLVDEVLLGVAITALVVWMIVRRTRGVRLSTRRLLLLPGVFLVIGLVQLGTWPSGMHGGDWLLFGIGVLCSVGVGGWRGTTVELSVREGVPFMRYTWVTVVLWIVMIALRLGLLLLAAPLGAAAISNAELYLLLALTFGTETAVLLPRAHARGLPVLRV